MKYKHLIALPILLGSAIYSVSAAASSLAVGYIAYDVTSPGSTAEFDITNGTGLNSSGDSSLPVSSTLLFSG